MTAPAWLPVDLRTQVEAPLTSTRLNRSAARLAFVVAQFLVEVAPRYQRRDVTGDGSPETFCNFFVREVLRALGVQVPEGLRANALHAWLAQQASLGVTPGWERVPQHVAQRAADEGMVVVAAWPNPSGPGHMAVLVPSLGEAGVWVAQAGLTNFTRGLLQHGFGSVQPDFFVHP